MMLLAAFAASVCPQPNSKNEKLQRAADHAVGERAAAAIVAEVSSGEILAAHGMDLAARRLERPGSTVKAFVLMTLLELRKLNESERLMCRRPLWIGGVRMDCSHPASVVYLDAEEAIAYSCNSYFAGRRGNDWGGPALVMVARSWRVERGPSSSEIWLTITGHRPQVFCKR